MSDEQVPVAGAAQAAQAAQAILQPVPPPEPGPSAAGPANPEPLQVNFLEHLAGFLAVLWLVPLAPRAH